MDFFGSESQIIEVLRKFDISNDLYSVTLQCYSCCASFNIVTQLGSINEVASTLQESISNKMRHKKCKKCDSTGSSLEILSGTFNAIPSIQVVELGHIPETSSIIRSKYIDELIYKICKQIINRGVIFTQYFDFREKMTPLDIHGSLLGESISHATDPSRIL